MKNNREMAPRTRGRNIASALVATLALVCACGDDDVVPDAAADSGALDGARDAGRDAAPACDPACPPGEVCCGEPDGTSRCSAFVSDLHHCGGCNVDCTMGLGTMCVTGSCACGLASVGCLGTRQSTCCPPRGGVGVEYCADFDVDTSDCGGCGIACELERASECVGGTCICGADRRACDGTASDTCCFDTTGTAHCLDTLTDRFNCGGCGVRCETIEACDRGTCTRGTSCPASCGADEICCDGVCCDRVTCERGLCAPDAGA